MHLRKTFPSIFVWIALPIGLVAQQPSPNAANHQIAGAKPEVIVCLRHGEKPRQEFGQLNCQGLNRALALPKILVQRYGTPQFIFAPDPGKTLIKGKDNLEYCYTRALATIEPTAIEVGLPVQTTFGFRDIEGLQQELLAPKYQTSTIFVAWEHRALNTFVRNMIAALHGDPEVVPSWGADDFDSIYVLTIETTADGRVAKFQHDVEGLDHLSPDCGDSR